MPENKEIKKVDFPMKLKFGKEPKTNFLTEKEAIKVTMLSHPPKNFRENCFRMIKATWEDSPIKDYSEEEVQKTFMDLLKGRTLPNSMESLTFTFLIEGINLVEITHLLRHREFRSVHAETSGDRDLRNDDAMIPEDIKNSKFKDEYIRVTEEAKKLYAKMVDDGISIMSARYVLNRNHLYYYYITLDLRTAIRFISQRKCNYIQPLCDNLIAKGIYENICKIIPEFKEVVSLKCDKKTCYVPRMPLEGSTRLYQPDEIHANLFDFNRDNFVYSKTRKEMGIPDIDLKGDEIK